MEIIKATMAHARQIRDIAVVTWADTYKDLLSDEQRNYMIEMMYSFDSLNAQMNELGHHFYLIKEDNAAQWQGFVSYEHDYKNANRTKLHKLYVLPECHGLGLGRVLIDLVCRDAKEYGNESVTLNMNRDNPTLNFYKHIGFEIIGEEDIDIGNGFLMEDYIFEKKL